MQLADLFDASFVRHRHQPALETETADGQLVTLTFGDLDERSNRLARVFAERGCRHGDRLCLYLPNSVAFIEAFLACVKLGVIVVPMNVLYREREISHIVADAEPRAVVTTGGVSSSFPSGVTCWDVQDLSPPAARMRSESVRVAIDGENPAALVYTSGTTGRSKGAVLSHNNFLANAANLLACWRITAADRYLAVLPLFHVHGLGNGLVMLAGQRLPHATRRAVRRRRAPPGCSRRSGRRCFSACRRCTCACSSCRRGRARARSAARARLFVCGSAPLAGARCSRPFASGSATPSSSATA